MIKNGTRLASQVCDTQVIVVRSAESLDDLRCGGAPMRSPSADIESSAHMPFFRPIVHTAPSFFIQYSCWTLCGYWKHGAPSALVQTCCVIAAPLGRSGWTTAKAKPAATRSFTTWNTIGAPNRLS